MRVIGGTLKGRRFSPPKSFDGRPTTDFAREALFNVLQHYIEYDGLEVLDIFCGTGAVTFEFASRGASSILAIDKSWKHVKYVHGQAKAFELDQVKSYKANALEWMKKTDLNFDLVFADPPYNLPELPELPDMIFASGLLRPGALFVLEHGEDFKDPGHPFHLETRRYGGVHFSFYRDEASE